MNLSSCATAIGSTFPVHLDVSSFPIGETPIRIEGFFFFEVLTLATPSIVIPPPGGIGCMLGCIIFYYVRWLAQSFARWLLWDSLMHDFKCM